MKIILSVAGEKACREVLKRLPIFLVGLYLVL